MACLCAITCCQCPQPGLQPDAFSSMLNRDEIVYSNLSSVSYISINKPISSRHKRSLGGHISVCRHVTFKHNSFWRYKPVMISKRYPKFKELKIMLITETSSFHFHGASDLQYVLFLLLRVFFLIWFTTQNESSKFLAPFDMIVERCQKFGGFTLGRKPNNTKNTQR